MEAFALLVLAVALGIPAATRWLAFALLGPLVLLTLGLWVASADAGVWGWTALAAVAGAMVGAHERSWQQARRDKRSLR